MRIKCENCGTVYNFPDDRLSPDGTPVKCKKCSHVFVAYPKSGPTAEPAAGPTPTKPGTETGPKPPPPGRATGDRPPGETPQFASVQSAPPQPRSRADVPEIDVKQFQPGENWLKFVLGFAICIALSLLAWYFITIGPKTDEVWARLDAQVDLEKDLERQLNEALAAREAVKGQWDYYYDGLSAMAQNTDEGYLKAQSDFRTAIEIKPEFVEARAGLAESMVSVSSASQQPNVLAEAEETAAAALQANPNKVEPHRAVAHVALAREDFATAQSEIDKALAIAPNDGLTHVIQAKLYLKQERYDLAAESLLNAVANDSLLLEANFLLSQLYANRMDWAKAVGYARNASAINPDHELVRQYLQIYQEQLERERNPDIALREQEQVLGPDGGPTPTPLQQESDYQTLMRAGRALHSQKGFWKAVGKFQQASELEPTRCEPLEALGFVYYDLNQIQPARVHFARALAGGDLCPKAHIGLATLYQDSGDAADAIKEYEKFLAIQGRGPQADEVRAILATLKGTH